MTTSIDFFYDFRSPYSYLASTQLESLNAEIRLRPIKLLTLMELVGNAPTTITCKAKGLYAKADLGRWAHRYGVTLNPSDMMSNDGNACARAVLAAVNTEDALAVTSTLFQAIWSHAKPLPDSSSVLSALQEASIDTTAIADRIESAEITSKLDRNTEQAAKRGVFGAPTLFVGEAMFFGNDRMEFVKDALARAESA